MDSEDAAALRAKTPEQRLKRGLEFIRRRASSKLCRFVSIIPDGAKKK